MNKGQVGWVSDFNNLLPEKIKNNLKVPFERLNVLNEKSFIDFLEKFLKKPVGFSSLSMWFTPKPQYQNGASKLTFFQTYTIRITTEEIEVKISGKVILAFERNLSTKGKKLKIINKSGEGFSVMKNIFRELIY